DRRPLQGTAAGAAHAQQLRVLNHALMRHSLKRQHRSDDAFSMPMWTSTCPDLERCAQQRRSERAERGFTLIEIIVVLVLVGVLLAVGLSSLSSVRRNSADTRYVSAASTIWRGIGSYR